MYTTNVKDRYRCRNPSTARAILNPPSCDKERRRHWAQLIQKVYEVAPLLCSRCAGPMRVIAFIEQADVICKILKHLDLWDPQCKPAPRAHGPTADLRYQRCGAFQNWLGSALRLTS